MSSSKKHFVANLLRQQAHQLQHFRVGFALVPEGKRVAEWRAGDLARCGHLSLLRLRLAQLAADCERGQAAVAVECTVSPEDANAAAAGGFLRWSYC